MIKRRRCEWVQNNNVLYEKYHDQEWGRPVRNDRKIFEFIILESAQAGLSWALILKKRAGYKKAFKNFDAQKVARMTATDIKKLLQNKDIIRNRAKIEAAINNAKIFLKIQKEFGSFSKYMWAFVKNKTIKHKIKKLGDYPKTIKEAETLAHDLKKRGFKFFGPVVCYAHMQAVGMANDHMAGCFLA